jgi:UDP-galactopyranose mutase
MPSATEVVMYDFVVVGAGIVGSAIARPWLPIGTTLL